VPGWVSAPGYAAAVIRLHDTATRSLLPLAVQGRRVRLYVCGITPYDGGHLGHAFTYHTYDVLTRRLHSLGHQVRSIRNITDVDDDMMRVSRQRGIAWGELAELVVRDFDRDMAAIGILEVDDAPRASQHVPAMIDWISQIAGNGFAYAVEGYVYFEVSRLPAYGGLSGLEPDEMIRLSRERGADPDDRRKRAPLDFVLWQPSLPGEPSWESPWGRGRPGWHIECTVLAVEHLGTPIDVHGGGDDLVFPHHEAEAAQARGAGVDPYVSHWVHGAMVGYRGRKMSKSLGNLVFVRDLLRRASPAAIRLLLAGHHHREAWEHTDAGLEAAVERERRYAAAAAAQAALGAAEAESWRHDFMARIDDDLDTPGALGVADRLAERLLSAPGVDGEATEGGALLAELLDLVGAGSRVARPAV
jgi:L-cysteine:1D-myo-inositol 2-amino-2-deoxy-alpha-D-glucopyranoside ligase